MNGSEAGGDVALIQPSLGELIKCIVLYFELTKIRSGVRVLRLIAVKFTIASQFASHSGP